MASKTSHESSSSSSSKTNFKWATIKDGGGNGGAGDSTKKQSKKINEKVPRAAGPATAVSRFRLAVTTALRRHGRTNIRSGSSRVITGTLYGHRRRHVHLAFQVDPRSRPFVLLDLATPTNSLVREMASGLVRVALECEGEARGGGGDKAREPKRKPLLEETVWLAYCNGRKCGYAVARECGPSDWKVLEAVGPVSMGAGVIPKGGGEKEEEVMYMRARFERVVGSRDSEAFYMMSPEGKGGAELSIFFLRV